jgi:sugar phosphate isomerase/epimerase
VDKALHVLEKGEISLTAGMIGFAGEDYSSIATIRQTGGVLPDALWPQRWQTLENAAKAAQRLLLSMLSTHIGFVPASNEPVYGKVVERVRQAADLFKEHGLTLLMETGQESAHGLLQFLNDVARPNLAVNFDPANMILYGSGNPVDAVRVLDRHIHHVHIKDAVPSAKPGVQWGEEVPFGRGHVNAMAFIESLRFGGYRGPLVIEREAGATRVADIHHAVSVLAGILTPRPTADGE